MEFRSVDDVVVTDLQKQALDLSERIQEPQLERQPLTRCAPITGNRQVPIKGGSGDIQGLANLRDAELVIAVHPACGLHARVVSRDRLPAALASASPRGGESSLGLMRYQKYARQLKWLRLSVSFPLVVGPLITGIVENPFSPES